MVWAERVTELLEQRLEIEDRPGAVEIGRVAGPVEFRDVVFGYKPDQVVLQGLNLRAEPGETIALVGLTGAGKSCFVNALARFYEPQSRQVLVDGQDLSGVTQRSWRSLGELQDTSLFAGTTRENTRYGRPEASDAEVEAAVRAGL